MFFFLHSSAHPPDLPSFPTRRSSDLTKRLEFLSTTAAAALLALVTIPSGGTTGWMMAGKPFSKVRSEEHTSELQSHSDLVCRLLLEKKKKKAATITVAKSARKCNEDT